jgi:hypothetical protein
MPRFYFHLSAPDEIFRDDIGCDIADIPTAHSRAVQLADRVMTFSGFADREPDFRHWTIEITDDCQRPVITVIFPAPPENPRANASSGARELQQCLALALQEYTPPYHASSAPRDDRNRWHLRSAP